MAETESQSAEADEEEREEFAWASQTPTTRVSGVPTGIIYAGDLSDSVAQNDTSFGLVLKNVDVEVGELFANEARDGGTVKDVVDEESTVPTDYRIADPDDKDASFDRDGKFQTEEEGTVDGELADTYVEADGVDEDEIIIWYNGLSGQRLGRVLDFNGQPYARWTDDGNYLIKGLYQCANGWREARGSDRGDLARAGKAPRVARAPILRWSVEHEYDDEGDITSTTLHDEPQSPRILVDVSRAQNGRGYRLNVFDAEQFEDEYGSLDADLPLNDDGYVDDDTQIDWNYDPAADDVLDEAGFRMHMYTGDGWPEEPENWEPSSTSEVGSFGINTSSDDGGEGGLTAEETQFVREVTEDLKGTGMTPEERYSGGLAGLVGKHQDGFSSAPDVDAIEEAVFAEVAHLDVDDLEE